LKFLFKVFRIFNLFWIIFCALMVEMTLNKNNMWQTLAQNSSIIQYPSQLLPLLVGGLSFIRVLWLIYVEGRDRVKVEKDSNQARFNRHETMTKPSLGNAYGLGLNFFKILSPAKQPREAVIFEAEPSLPPPLKPWHHRYLVALLPWLSAFEAWKLTDKHDAEVDPERSAPMGASESFPQDLKVEPSSEIR
jgi:hypothetical protein